MSAGAALLLGDARQVDADDVYRLPGRSTLRALSRSRICRASTRCGSRRARRWPRCSADEQADIFPLLDARRPAAAPPVRGVRPGRRARRARRRRPGRARDQADAVPHERRVADHRGLSAPPTRGKQVTVLVELTARFDEERNIRWARALEEAGAHVIYGVRGYKMHAKICLVVRRTPRGPARYVHLGTGNYNERTARLYTDFGLLTTSQEIGADASAFFNALTGYSDPPRLKKLVMAPTRLRERLLELIDRERRRAEAGQPARILAKMNSLIDDEIIAGAVRGVAGGRATSG